MFPIYNYESLVNKYSSGPRSTFNSEHSERKQKDTTQYYVRNFDQHDFEKDINSLQSRLQEFKVKTEEMEKKYNESHTSTINKSIYKSRQKVNHHQEQRMDDQQQPQQHQKQRMFDQCNQKMEQLIEFNQKILQTNEQLEHENRMMRQQLNRMNCHHNHCDEQSVYQMLKSVYDQLEYIDRRDRTKIAILIDKISSRLKS